MTNDQVTRVDLVGALTVYERAHGYSPDTLRITRAAWNEVRKWCRDEMLDTGTELLTSNTPIYLMGCRVCLTVCSRQEILDNFAYEFRRFDSVPPPQSPRMLPLSGAAVSARQLAVAALLREPLSYMTDEEFELTKKCLPSLLATFIQPRPVAAPVRERVVEL